MRMGQKVAQNVITTSFVLHIFQKKDVSIKAMPTEFDV